MEGPWEAERAIRMQFTAVKEKRKKRKVGWKHLRLQCSCKESLTRFLGSSRVKVAHHSSPVSPRNRLACGITASLNHWLREANRKHGLDRNMEINFKAQHLGPWVNYAFCNERSKRHILMAATYCKVVFARWLIVFYGTGRSNDKA